MYDQSIKQEFIYLRARGKSLSNSAQMLEIARSTAVRWNREYQYEIGEAKKAPADAILSSFGLHAEERLKTLGAIAKSLKDRLLSNSSVESYHKDLASFFRLIRLIEQEETRTDEKRKTEARMALLRKPQNVPGIEAGDDVYYITRDTADDPINVEGQYDNLDIQGSELEKKILEWAANEEDISETVRIPREVMIGYGLDPDSAQNRPASLDEFLHSGMN